MNREQNNMVPKKLDLPQDTFEPILFQSVELEQMADEVIIHIHGADGPCELKSCYGDIYKIVNALRDYARMLEMSCGEWKLTGFHLATYELHAQKLRAIADKYQAAIGYDYDAAVKQCRRKYARKQRDDIGGDAMTLAVNGSARVKKVKTVDKTGGEDLENSPWENEL